MIKEMNMVAINREATAVYLLDDDASILKATRRLLDSAGWNNVETFTDPNAFLQRAAMDPPDLAVIDMAYGQIRNSSPNDSGGWLRRHGSSKHLPCSKI